jgi:hypothetical protein
MARRRRADSTKPAADSLQSFLECDAGERRPTVVAQFSMGDDHEDWAENSPEVFLARRIGVENFA